VSDDVVGDDVVGDGAAGDGARPRPTPDLRAALAAAHAHLDDWADVALGVAAEADDTDEALADPRLEAAQDAFQDALGRVEEAVLVTLGLVPEQPDDAAPEAPAERLLVDDFHVHLVVGVGEDSPPERLDAAFEVIDDAAVLVVERLEAAGFVVPEFGTIRGVDDDVDGRDGADGAGPG
jgi:hypothetical protein